MERFEQTAATSADEVVQTDERTGTGLGAVVGVALSRPGLFMASLVLGAALTSGGTPVSVTDLTRRRRETEAESSTAQIETDNALLSEVRDLFERGAEEFFVDGVHSHFSKSLLRLLMLNGKAALHAISEYVLSGDARPDVVSEALRWIADFKDASIFMQRWTILQQTLKDRSPRVRDGAILGFGSLDDPRARPLLLEARNLEQIGELRTMIERVIAQLERPR